MTVAAPLFVIGCPRSGTTLLVELLAATRSFGYVGSGVEGNDATAWVDGRTRVYDLPLVGEQLLLRRRSLMRAAGRLGPLGRAARHRLPVAVEPWDFWTDLLPNFRPEFGDGPAVDPDPAGITDTDRQRAVSVVEALLHEQRRTTLVSKYTDFPRVDLIRSVFPGARFVHIRRDAAAVANSNAVEIEAGRFGTWRYRDWWSAEWAAGAAEHWRANGETMLGFAAHNRNRLVGLIDDAVRGDDGVMTVSYEDLTSDAGRTIRGILGFAAVDSRTDIERLVGAREIQSSNQRWRDRREPDEIRLLEEIVSVGAPWPVP